MRIVHVSHNYYPFVGGLERVVQGLAETQAIMGHQVDVITSNCVAKGNPDEVLNGVNIKRINAWRLHYPELTIPKNKEKLCTLFKQADVVHVHGHNSLFCLEMLNKASSIGVKTACYFMAVDVFNSHPNWFVRSFAPYYGKRVTKKALKLTELSLVKSMKDKEVLCKTYGAESIFLPDALPEYYFTNKKSDPIEIRTKFGIKQEKFFLFIGRMHWLKGPQILVEALKYVQDDVAAVFIGPDGGFLKATMDLAERLGIKDRVYFLRFVDEASKISVLDSAIALVLPSMTDYVEVYPGVISEAWAREKPVIASRVGGVPYRVKEGVNGLLVDPSNPKALAKAMMELAGNNELATKMGKLGKEDVFSWNQVATKSIEVYQQLPKQKILGLQV